MEAYVKKPRTSALNKRLSKMSKRVVNDKNSSTKVSTEAGLYSVFVTQKKTEVQVLDSSVIINVDKELSLNLTPTPLLNDSVRETIDKETTPNINNIETNTGKVFPIFNSPRNTSVSFKPAQTESNPSENTTTKTKYNNLDEPEQPQKRLKLTNIKKSKGQNDKVLSPLKEKQASDASLGSDFKVLHPRKRGRPRKVKLDVEYSLSTPMQDPETTVSNVCSTGDGETAVQDSLAPHDHSTKEIEVLEEESRVPIPHTIDQAPVTPVKRARGRPKGTLKHVTNLVEQQTEIKVSQSPRRSLRVRNSMSSNTDEIPETVQTPKKLEPAKKIKENGLKQFLDVQKTSSINPERFNSSDEFVQHPLWKKSVRSSGQRKSKPSGEVQKDNSVQRENLKTTKTLTKKRRLSRSKEPAEEIDLGKSDDEPFIIENSVNDKTVQLQSKITDMKYNSVFEETECFVLSLPSHVGLPSIDSSEDAQRTFNFKLTQDGAHFEHVTNGFLECRVEPCPPRKGKSTARNTSSNESTNVKMWSDKYRPFCSKDMISPNSALQTLSDWLLDWKSKGRGGVDESSCSSYGSYDEGLIKCVLLSGNTGVGKTSMVYALAEEHKFKVIEVNSSSLRSGKIITSQLQEATQSHHVEGSSSMHKFFTNNISRKTIKPKNIGDVKPNDKIKKDRKVTGIMSFFKKKSELVTDTPEMVEMMVKEEQVVKNKTMQHFFKPQVKPPVLEEVIFDITKAGKGDKKLNTEPVAEAVPLVGEISEDSSLEVNVIKVLDESEATTEPTCSIGRKDEVEDHALKFSSSSIILFDDVDVVFEEDEAFWSSVNNFIRDTKKPVILTASHSLKSVRASIRDAEFQELLLESRPREVRKYIKNVCQKEEIDLKPCDLKLLLWYCNFDPRRLLLELQFWTETVFPDEPSSSVPIILFCLNESLRHRFRSVILNASISRSLGILEQFASENCHLLHANLTVWFPWLIETSEERPSSGGSENRPKTSLNSSGDIPTGNQSETGEIKSELKNCSTKLNTLSGLFDSFSFCDTLGFNKKEPVFGTLPAADDSYSNSLGREISTALQLCSIRTCHEKLKLDTANGKQFCGEDRDLKLFGFDKYNCTTVKYIRDITDDIIPVGVPLVNSVRVDYLSALREIHKAEVFRQINNSSRTRRFLHYFDSAGLSVDMVQLTKLSKAFE